MNKLEKTKKKLDSVSPSLCLAKWQQVTVHLQNGHTHSCHHPQTHKVPLEELEKNSSALHNTTYKKFQRKLMLEGKRPDECDYCWKVEDTKGNHYSDRIKKSSNSTWAMPYFDQVVNADWNANVTPAQVEVSFGNVCNMKCVYCSPVFSSEWWKWWPEIKSQLRTLRITGGEPLLNKNTFKLLDELDTEPQPAMNLEINTNLSVDTATVSKTLDQIADLKLTKSINNAVIHTSCDCAGEQAEYIREGMQYDQWLSHCKMVLKRGISLHIMVTANMLSIDTMIDLMTAVYRLKQEYKGVTYGVSILHSPKFLNVLNLPKTQYWQDKFTELFDFVKAQQTTDINEFNYIDRLCKYFAQNSLEQQEQIKLTQDAKTFIKEIDRRRNKNFTNTFPNYNFLTT